VTGDTSVASYTLDIAARRSRDPSVAPDVETVAVAVVVVVV